MHSVKYEMCYSNLYMKHFYRVVVVVFLMTCEHINWEIDLSL